MDRFAPGDENTISVFPTTHSTKTASFQRRSLKLHANGKHKPLSAKDLEYVESAMRAYGNLRVTELKVDESVMTAGDSVVIACLHSQRQGPPYSEREFLDRRFADIR